MCRKCWKKLKDIILQDSNVACNSRTNHSLSNCIEQSFQQKWESWYTLATYLLLRFLAWLWFRRRSRRLVLVFRKLWLCFTLCTLKGKSTYIASSRTCLCLHHIIFVCFTWNACSLHCVIYHFVKLLLWPISVLMLKEHSKWRHSVQWVWTLLSCWWAGHVWGP